LSEVSSSSGIAYSLTATGQVALAQAFATNTYTVSNEDFANPERGFYFQADSYASAPSSVPANLASYRINGKSSPGNTYTAKISLLLRLFYLDTFVNAPISSNFLNSIQTDFNSIRAQGCKAVVRLPGTDQSVRRTVQSAHPGAHRTAQTVVETKQRRHCRPATRLHRCLGRRILH
jgi:hypothetical protein